MIYQNLFSRTDIGINTRALKPNDPFYGNSFYFKDLSYYAMSFRDSRNRSHTETCSDREAIMSQFRVWPFLSTIIMTFGERNRNPGHPFKYYFINILFKQ